MVFSGMRSRLGRTDIELDNLGITEAKNLDGFVTIILVKKREIPDLAKKRWKTNLHINVLVPKFHKTISIQGYKNTLDKPEPLLTSEIASGMTNGSLSMLSSLLLTVSVPPINSMRTVNPQASAPVRGA